MSRWHIPILAGLLLRVLLILVSPEGGMTGGDFPVYHGTANALASGAGAWFSGGELGWRPPLSFVYLALAYLPFAGEAPFWLGQLATGLLFVPIIVLLGKLALRLGFSEKATLILVWLRSTLPLFVISDVQPLSEPLFAVMMLAFLLAGMDVAVDPSRKGKLVLFSLLGVGMVLTRELGSVLFFLGAIALIPRLWSFGPKTLVQAGLWVTLVAGLALGPWLYRNHLTYGQALPISATAGFNLHVGNHPDADGRYVLPEAESHEPPDSLHWATRGWDRWHKERALSYIAEHPGRFLKLIPNRLGYLFFPRAARSEIVALDIFPGLSLGGKYLLVALSALSSALLLLAIPIGFRLLPAGWFRDATLLFTLGLIASVAVTHGMPRFFDPVMHFVLPGLALFLADPREQLAKLRGRFSWVLVASWVMTGAFWGLIVMEKI